MPIIANNLYKNGVFTTPYKLNIHLPNVTLTSFDWINNKRNDIIVCGDETGNIFLIKLMPNSFEVIKTYFQAHSEEITDLRFFPCNSDENILFASSSNDGFLRIFDDTNSETPLYDLHISQVKILLKFIFLL